MMRLVSNKINPDMSKMTAPEIAKLNAGICKNKFAMIATNITIIPVNKNPAKKLKFFLVVSAYQDKLRKINAVPPKACDTIAEPFT